MVGDRRMLRFLRGKQNNVQEAAKMFSAFLKWRDENKVDDIRNQILYGGLDTPFKFPNGKKIIDLAPQIIISSNARDNKGQPLGNKNFTFGMFCMHVILNFNLISIGAIFILSLGDVCSRDHQRLSSVLSVCARVSSPCHGANESRKRREISRRTPEP